ncbi:hypothetical protein BJX96DRAFT_182069 [Aspergillus floccosus]
MEKRPPLPERPSAKATFNPKTESDTASAWDREKDTRNPPPPYCSLSSAPFLVHSQISDAGPRQSSILPKPCVVPQTSHTLHGSIYRPFARAYAPNLGDHGISASDFLAFIDGLNEVWLANPYLQATSAASSLLGLLPLLETQLVAMGVQVAAEYGSIKVSQLRTQAYMKLANEQLFAPRRLRVQVLRTKAMMEEVGIPGEVLDLAPVLSERDEEGDDVFSDADGDAGEGSSSQKTAKEVKGGSEIKYDPQMRRLEAIRDYVLPLTFADALPLSDNCLKRASEKQERVFSEKQNTRLAERREKAAKLAAEAEAIRHELASQLEELEALKTAARDRARERLQGPLGESMQGQLIVQEDLEKEMKKLNKKTDKLVKEGEKKIGKKLQKSERGIARAEKREMKIAQKVMWIVVTGDDGRGFQNHLWEDLDC